MGGKACRKVVVGERVRVKDDAEPGEERDPNFTLTHCQAALAILGSSINVGEKRVRLHARSAREQPLYI